MARDFEAGDHRVILTLPSVDADDLLAACEVLWQEGHRTWALPAAAAGHLGGLLSVFGRRARIGVCDVDSAEEAAKVALAGAAFVSSRFCLPELVAGAGAVPVILGGLTPQELRACGSAGAAVVQVTPCEAFGTVFARALPEMMAPLSLIAAGRLERYQADNWLGAGAVAVWPQGLIGVDLVVDADLDGLRQLAQRWRETP